MAKRTWKQNVIDYAVYLTLRMVVCIVQALSLEACESLCRFLGWFVGDKLKLRDNVLEENLCAVFPELNERQRRRLKRRMWEHLGMLGCEIAHSYRKVHETNWRKFVSIADREAMVSNLLDPRPCICVSGHFGNFEMAGYIAGLLGFPTYAIARPLDNPYIDRFVKRLRGKKGQYILPKDGSAPIVQKILERGGTISLLADQHAGPNGCWVDFLGRPASCHKAVAVFPLTAGATLMVCYVRRTGGALQLEVGINGVVDPANLPPELKGIKPMTKWYNDRLAELVLAHPDQYWWVHRRWKEPPAKQAKRLKRAA